MKWVNFLHIYQPPTQSREVIDRLVRESYALIPALCDKYPKVRLTMNISGSLLEQLDKYGYKDLIEKYRKLVKEGRIELVGSAMYHPIMPLATSDMIRREVKQNDAVLKNHFGATYKPRGFYFPEMAYNRVSGEIVKELGFEWTILDPIHASEPVQDGEAYQILDSGLGVIFRNKEFSRSFPPEYIMTNMKKAPDTLVTGHDGELYGHWHTEDRGFYEKVFTSAQVEMATVSEHLDSVKDRKQVKLRKASWETTEDEISAKVPYALWDLQTNKVHQGLWKLARLVEKTVMSHRQDERFEQALGSLDRGFASCAWWWASGRKLGPFSPVSWHPEEIEKGGMTLLQAVRTLKDIPLDERLRIEKAFSAVRDLVWQTHWSKYARL